jgi:peptide-methionine (R)-S-oxide reductase
VAAIILIPSLTAYPLQYNCKMMCLTHIAIIALIAVNAITLSTAFSTDTPRPLRAQCAIKHSIMAAPLSAASDDSDPSSNIHNRRDALRKGLTFGSLVAATLTSQVPIQSAAVAKNIKSRTIGYDVQHTEVEWSNMLSKQQYFILREGGTESPYSSILEGEERAGLYICAACKTPLFDAKEKFHSGTGWPSFASPLMSTSDTTVSNVEMEDVSTFQYQLAGAEVRCHTCGGHLGDVFADGFLFVGKF